MQINKLSGDMMSWHRKLRQVLESSPEFQSIYPPTTVRSYPRLYGGIPPDLRAEPPTDPLVDFWYAEDPSESTPSVGMIVGTVLGGLILLVALGIFVIWYIRRNRRRPDEGTTTNDERQHTQKSAISNPQMLPLSVPRGPSRSFGLVHRSLCTFSYEELDKATESFSKTNLLGEGGYGTVHKGVLPGGKMVAIKQRSLSSKQGEKEFWAEVEIGSRVHHKNLVSLVGYCISEKHEILVYEFVPKGSLHSLLHGKEKTTIDWPTRMNIALGSANGLAYLHEECNSQIIHRDIKTSNILLDDKFVVKVADFGLAKFSSDTKSYVSTDVKGTPGYLDPAYYESEKLTDKADIFSFGVVLLELITGREPKSETELLYRWAKPLVKQALENGNFDALIDRRLQNQDIRSDEIHRMVGCAAACVRNSASNRPKMSQIVRALEGNLPLEDLYGGSKPGDSEENLKKFEKLLQEDYKEDTNEQSKPSTNYVSALQIAR